MEILGFFLATLVGVTLGLIGGGGAILAVPILVYVMHINPLLATTYSLFIVGTTALVGGVQKAREENVDFKTVFVFGIPSIITVYTTRMILLPMIPNNLISIGGLLITKPIALLLLFAIVMIAASMSMIKSGNKKNIEVSDSTASYHYKMILLEGIFVGLLTGLVGAGGGFLIIPALVILAKMPMQRAVGTSLFIIACNSLFGFSSEWISGHFIDWKILGPFTLFALGGIFIGFLISKKIPGDKLKKVFGWFVLVMGIYIIIKELFL
jgi:uncharacterized membrane protein YfcA